MQLQTLGNLIGSSSHLGSCPTCGAQHMSTHDRVLPNPSAPWQFVCARCAQTLKAIIEFEAIMDQAVKSHQDELGRIEWERT